MAGFLTMSSVMMCPHGGQVTAITTNVRVQAGGDFMVRATDTFIIAGCPFTIPAVVPIPHPCVQVQWVVSSLLNQVMSGPALTEESVGLCLGPDGAPQGTVLINFTQPLVSGE